MKTSSSCEFKEDLNTNEQSNSRVSNTTHNRHNSSPSYRRKQFKSIDYENKNRHPHSRSRIKLRERNHDQSRDKIDTHHLRRRKDDLKPHQDYKATLSTASTTTPSVSRSSPHVNTSVGLDHFTKLRTTGSAITLSPLEKAAVHASQYLAMDPLEKMRRQVEQTIEAKLGLLQTKLDNARDPKNKTQRKVYIGNLIPSISGEFLKQLFTQTLLISYPQWNAPGQDCVIEVQYRDGNKYCFLEFRTMEMAMAALHVNGVTVLGTQLQVSRSTGFLDPVDCERAFKDAEKELASFRSGEDEGPLLRQPSYIDLVTKIKSRQDESHQFQSEETKPSFNDFTTYLSFEGFVTSSALDSSNEVQNIYEDVKSKVSEFGEIIRMVIPRPPMGISGLEVFGKKCYGKAYVQFANLENAKHAKNALHGMVFDGRTVIVQFLDENAFSNALGL